MTLAFLALAVLFLAYSNGANDNFKGVATLFGSSTASYRKALAWATLTTLAGSLSALALASGLVDAFQGRDLVPEAVTRDAGFLLSVALGAALTIILATRLGLPVSTTHALTGALVGVGLLASAGAVRLEALGRAFLLPLLLSPVVAMLLTLLLYPAFRAVRRAWGITSQSCICVGTAHEAVETQRDGSLKLVRTGVIVQTGRIEDCVERYQGRVLGLQATQVVDALHFVSAGAVGFARGLNDTPKIVALLLAGQALAPESSLALVAVAMAVGGLLQARRVAHTMSKRITRINPGPGFTGNLVTAALVCAASGLGLPVSTTHVSVGSLFGVAVVNRKAQARTLVSILLAWATTLPLAAALAGGIFFVGQSL